MQKATKKNLINVATKSDKESALGWLVYNEIMLSFIPSGGKTVINTNSLKHNEPQTTELLQWERVGNTHHILM